MSDQNIPTIDSLAKDLTTLHLKISKLDIPPVRYAGVKIGQKEIEISQSGNEDEVDRLKLAHSQGLDSIVLDYFQGLKTKIVASGLASADNLADLASKLWLEADIIPQIHLDNLPLITSQELMLSAQSSFDGNNLIKINISNQTLEVEVAPLVQLNEYQKITPKSQYLQLERLAKKFAGKKLVFINATAQGGGVALMRHAIIRLLKMLGVDAHWYVLIPQKDIFDITKTKLHNILQAVAGDDLYLTQEEIELFNNWTMENYHKLKPALKDADIVVIDDPQPSGLISLIKRLNPTAKIIYRSHIQIESKLADKPGTPQHKTWQFIWDNIKDSDLFVSHPIRDFIPKSMPLSKVVMMPAATDPLDGLNKPLTYPQQDYYLKVFNRMLLESGQTILDLKRDYIIQIARFDPSKGIPDVLNAYKILVKKLHHMDKPTPQLIITGNGSIDDPDGKPILQMTENMSHSPQFQDLANDIKILRLPHMDQLLNSLLRRSKIALQLSYKEGYEVKVTEALMKGKPVVAYKAGGIPLQIQHKKTGFLAEVGDINQVANYLFELLTKPLLYKRMSQDAAKLFTKDALLIQNAINWLYLSSTLIEKGTVLGQGRLVKDLI